MLQSQQKIFPIFYLLVSDLCLFKLIIAQSGHSKCPAKSIITTVGHWVLSNQTLFDHDFVYNDMFIDWDDDRNIPT